MKKNILKSKKFVAKIALTILGFTLATSQALAQYMVIRPIPKPTLIGKLTGVTDTTSKFRIIINNQDTLYSSWKQKYKFFYQKSFSILKFNIDVTEEGKTYETKYQDAHKVIALKQDEDDSLRKEVEIKLKKKD